MIKATYDKICPTYDEFGNVVALTRNVYELSVADEDGDFLPGERVDVLDLHPEVRSAWRRANRLMGSSREPRVDIDDVVSEDLEFIGEPRDCVEYEADTQGRWSRKEL